MSQRKLSEAEIEKLMAETYTYRVPRGLPTGEAEILDHAARLELAIRETERLSVDQQAQWRRERKQQQEDVGGGG